MLAQKLMLKHDISMDEVTFSQVDKDKTIDEAHVTAYKTLYSWERTLFRNHYCRELPSKMYYQLKERLG